MSKEEKHIRQIESKEEANKRRTEKNNRIRGPELEVGKTCIRDGLRLGMRSAPSMQGVSHLSGNLTIRLLKVCTKTIVGRNVESLSWKKTIVGRNKSIRDGVRLTRRSAASIQGVSRQRGIKQIRLLKVWTKTLFGRNVQSAHKFESTGKNACLYHLCIGLLYRIVATFAFDVHVCSFVFVGEI